MRLEEGCGWLWGVWLIVSSYQSRYQAGQSRWCSRHWKGVCGSCCPRRRPWRWTGPGAHHLRSSSPTNWPLAGRSGRSQPRWWGAYVREKLATTQQHSKSTVLRKDYSCLFHLGSSLIYSLHNRVIQRCGLYPRIETTSICPLSISLAQQQVLFFWCSLFFFYK